MTVHLLGKGAPDVWEHQDDAVLDQDNPVSGTKYTVLDTTKNVRLISITAKVTWTAQPNPLEVWITIDGQVMRHYQSNAASEAAYFVQTIENESLTYQHLKTAQTAENRSFLYEGRSVKVEVETTDGTVSNLSARVKYYKK